MRQEIVTVTDGFTSMSLMDLIGTPMILSIMTGS